MCNHIGHKGKSGLPQVLHCVCNQVSEDSVTWDSSGSQDESQMNGLAITTPDARAKSFASFAWIHLSSASE